MDDPTIIAAIITIIPAVLCFLAAKPWLRARVRAMEYLQRRLALVSSILSAHRNILTPDQVVAMEGEINLITSKLLTSSIQAETDRILGWNRQVWWRRFLTLPKPVSVIDWITVLTFYLYLGFAVVYFSIYWPIAFLRPEPAIPNLALLLTSILCIGMCAVARNWRLRTATAKIASSRVQSITVEETGEQ